MHVLYLLITIVAVVAILWFGMPWVFETIHEPFQGGPSAVCRTPDTIQVLPPQVQPDDYTSYIEHGKQIYNRIGYGQSMLREGERAFKDRITDAALPELNEDIRQALVNVSAVPDSTPIPDSAIPISFQSDTRSGNVLVGIRNKAAVEDPNNNWNKVRMQAGYVEERVPPTSLSEKEALRCESVNLYTTYTEGGEIANRPSAIKRVDMCNMLGTQDASTGVINDLRPELSECGVCIKDGQPVSTSEAATWRDKFNSAMKFIGGMLFTNRDRDAYYASGDTSATPSLGNCAPGYFFVAGEKDKCLTAAQRLNCEEYGETGGFGFGKSKDGQVNADLSGSCVACATQGKTNYIYNDPRSSLANVQVRITVPRGTGKSFIRLARKSASAETYGQDIPETTSDSIVIPISQAIPNDDLRIDIFQEYPHRPRGEKEVFLVIPARKIQSDQIAQFVKEMDCEIATVQQLQDAYTNGAQAEKAGYAISFNPLTKENEIRPYTVRQYTKLQNTSIVNAESPVGVQLVLSPSTAEGVWCYGFKPRTSFLGSYQFGDQTKSERLIENFYTYIKLSNEDGLSAKDRMNRFSRYGDTLTIPQYRGVCIQFESTGSTSVRRTISAENFIMKVGDTIIRNPNGTLVSDVNAYSRNGTFADSKRIMEPKPTIAGMNAVLTNQYWLWDVSHEQSGFKLELKIPGIFADPSIAEDLPKCPTGPLYTSRTLLDYVELSPCSGGLTLECMKSIFEKYGGKPEGEWHPSKPTGRAELEFKDSKKTTRRTPEELTEYVKELQQIALGKSPSLSGLSILAKEARMNEVSQGLIGQKIVSECHTLVETNGVLQVVDRTGRLPEKCLDELYRQTTATMYSPTTYTDIAQRYSGIRNDELALPEIQSQYPYKTCQPTGSWAPIRSNGEVNEAAVNDINAAIASMQGNNSVQNARKLFNEVYQNANSTTVDKATQQLAIERCYGIKKKEFVSNCQGINARKVRIIPTIKSIPYTYFLIINGIYWRSTTPEVIRTGRMTKTEAPGILNTIKTKYPTASFVSSDEILALHNMGHSVYTVWAYNTTTNTIEPMRIATSESSVSKENFIDTSKFPILISVQSSDSPSNLIKTIMDVLPDNSADINGNLVPQKSVEILTRINLAPSVKVKSKETDEYIPYSNKLSKKVFIVSPAVNKQRALDILPSIKSVYSNAEFTTEAMIQDLRVNKQIGKCAWVWSQKTNSSDIQIALGSPDGWKHYTWCGSGTPNIQTLPGSEHVKEIYITLTSSDPDLLIIQKITAALGSSAYLSKVYDEEEYMNNLPYNYALSGDTTVQNVQISSSAIPSIVQLIDSSDRILTQHLATGTTVELNQIDLLPALAYKDLAFPAPGIQKIRLESFVGQGWFLTHDGKISNMDTRTTFTLTAGRLNRAPSGFGPSSANVSKIYRLEGPSGNFITKKPSGAVAVQIDTELNTSWVIRPALNGASAFVSLELANYPGTFLITEVGNNETYTAKCVQYTNPTELEKALTCWRLYPSDA